LEGFLAICSEKINEEEHIITIFGDQLAADDACNINIPTSDSQKLRRIQIKSLAQKRELAIRVWDIPLNAKPDEIHTTFAKYGNITGITMNTQQMWQSATIYYDDQKSKKQLINL
jgi:hypothetical protein